MLHICSRSVTTVMLGLKGPSPSQPAPFSFTAMPIDLWPVRMCAFILQLLFIDWLPIEKVLLNNGLCDLMGKYYSLVISSVPSVCDVFLTGARYTPRSVRNRNHLLESNNQLHCPVMSTALLKGEFLKLRTTTCRYTWVLWAFLLVVLPATDARLFTSQMSPRVVRTQYGEIRGVLITLPDTNLPLVEAYLGLQYASVLGGELRFMPPTSPMETWDGIRVALKFRPVCPQKIPKEEDLLKRLPAGRVEHFKRIIPFLERQAEECLNLNVYVPVRGKPVILCKQNKSLKVYKHASNLNSD